jgi:hypothetical protein
MVEYGRLIFFALVLCGFGPVLLILVYCLLTGLSRWLFCKRQDAESEPVPSAILSLLGKLYISLFTLYIALLLLFAYFGFR